MRPNDEYLQLGLQWPVDAMRLPEAWAITTGSPIIVAVLDTGIQWEHEDLQGRVLPGWWHPDVGVSAQDDKGHGTQVAGLIAAATNNSIGIAGVSWGAMLLPVKVCTSTGHCPNPVVAEGLRWAADQPDVRIIHASLYDLIYDPAVQEAVNYAHGRGVLVVAIAGNTGTVSDDVYPLASRDNMLVVGASTQAGGLATFSSRSSYVDVLAPGDGVASTGCVGFPLPYPGTPCAVTQDGFGAYPWSNATSVAGPHVSGVAALMLAVNPALTPDQVEAIIKFTALPVQGCAVGCGMGVIDAYAAVRAALGG